MSNDTTPEDQSPDANAQGFSSSATPRKREDRPSNKRTWRKPSARARRKFLKAFAECGVVLYACEQSGVSRRAIYWLKEVDTEFAIEWDAAYNASTERLEREAIRRANGYERTGIDRNGNVYTVQEHSDRLLEFVLMSRDDKYRVRRVEMTGKDGGAINVNDEAGSIRSKLLHVAAVEREASTAGEDER